MMKITNIRLVLLRQPRGRVLALADLTFDNVLVVEGFRVVKSSGRLFVGLPQRRTRDGQYRDVAYPINAELMDAIQRYVVRAYLDESQKLLSKRTESPKIAVKTSNSR